VNAEMQKDRNAISHLGVLGCSTSVFDILGTPLSVLIWDE
jgi:hypothetical protein